MATKVVDSIAIPRPRVAVSSASFSAPVAAWSCSRRRVAGPGRMSAFVTPRLGALLAATAKSKSGGRRNVVCEAKGQETTAQVPDVNKSTWQSLVLESDVPVLVQFWASWCGPCKLIDPIVTKLSKEYAGKMKFYKLNTDDNPDIATQYGIRSIPTMMVFRNGEKKDAIIGAVPETTLVTCIDKFVVL